MAGGKLHKIQRSLLNLLAKTQEDPLTIREMQERLHVSSTSVVAHHLGQLEKKGYLKRNPANPRDYHVVTGGPEKMTTILDLYGLARCGPRGSLLDGNPIDRIPVATRLLSFPSSEGFLVKAKGDSMSPKINDGDLVIARKTNQAESGAIVVCINDGEALIKKIQKDKRTCILISLNPEYAPFSAAKDFRLVGEVRGIISYVSA